MSVKQITTGQDSFLDIVANLVGVLIILVVVVGANASSSWQAAGPDEALISTEFEMSEELNDLSGQAKRLELDNHQLEQKIAGEAAAVAQLASVRQQMLVELQIVEQQIDQKKQERRQDLDQQQQLELDLIEKQTALKTELESIVAETLAIQASQPKSEVIDHHPNPIAKTVFSEEVHFHLRDGKISYVPFDALVQRMKSEWKVKAEKLKRANQTLETVGPIAGYRLQYELVSTTIEQPTPQGIVTRQGVQFDRFSIFPASGLPGVEIEAALQDQSEFRSVLARYVPGKTTVSVWVYPDSYGQYNQVKDWLYEEGFQVACWPLDFGRRISGGPNGFRTSAQ